MANRTKIENLQNLIKESIGGELVQQKVESLLPPGENYGSVMYKVDFKVRKDGREEEYHAVAKCTPPNTVTQELFNSQVTFKSEIGWYTTVIPALKQFQKDQGVEKLIDFFQPFYGSRISLDPTSEKVDLDGVILTQNLKYLGYYNIDRHIGFDLPTTYTILRDLATFHAVPLAMKLQNPELFDKKIKPYLSILGDYEEMKEAFNKPIFTAFEGIPECQSIMQRIKRSINKANIFGLRELREPWVTVVHMDFWMNNIMVTGGEDSKTMILDLQIPYYGSPAVDLAFFLLTSVNVNVVQEEYDDLVKFYYEQFSNNLKELNVSTKNYTFKGLLEELDIEMKGAEFAHIVGHTFIILAEKGKTTLDSSDENFKRENLVKNDLVINEKQIEKLRWLALEAAKRKWI